MVISGKKKQLQLFSAADLRHPMMGVIGILMGKYVFTLARLLGMSVNLQFLGCLKHFETTNATV